LRRRWKELEEVQQARNTATGQEGGVWVREGEEGQSRGGCTRGNWNSAASDFCEEHGRWGGRCWWGMDGLYRGEDLHVWRVRGGGCAGCAAKYEGGREDACGGRRNRKEDNLHDLGQPVCACTRACLRACVSGQAGGGRRRCEVWRGREGGVCAHSMLRVGALAWCARAPAPRPSTPPQTPPVRRRHGEECGCASSWWSAGRGKGPPPTPPSTPASSSGGRAHSQAVPIAAPPLYLSPTCCMASMRSSQGAEAAACRRASDATCAMRKRSRRGCRATLATPHTTHGPPVARLG
jgi:hypothetical protein